jgi:LCP family protein required for cell wall assembly
MPKIIKIVFFSVIAIFGLSFALFHFGIKFVGQKIDKSPEYINDLLKQVTENNPYSQKDKVNFIFLGLDERNDVLEKTQTTDTIIFASLNLKNNKTTLISIPRDLWFYDTNSKINDIYPQSLQQEDKFAYIKDKFSQLTGQTINHVIVLTTDNLIKFINLTGSLDVQLENGFVDNQYPNPDYIKDPKSGASKYITVKFDSGDIHLDESNITEFIRSRKGGNTVAQGGTDLARIQRQQLVIDALLTKIKEGKFINSFNQVLNLYKFWDQNIQKDITDIQAFQISSIVLSNIANKKEFSLEKKEIIVGDTAADGLIYHPTTFINKQWVFIPADKEYTSFKQFFSDSI